MMAVNTEITLSAVQSGRKVRNNISEKLVLPPSSGQKEAASLSETLVHITRRHGITSHENVIIAFKFFNNQKRQNEKLIKMIDLDILER